MNTNRKKITRIVNTTRGTRTALVGEIEPGRGTRPSDRPEIMDTKKIGTMKAVDMTAEIGPTIKATRRDLNKVVGISSIRLKMGR